MMTCYLVQGGSGSVQGVLFSNIQVSEVEFPIVIDQYYCDKRICKNQTSAVALSGINYEKIRGTYTIKPVHFACSDSLPCEGVTLTNIKLEPQQERYRMFNPFCWQTFGELNTPSLPPIDCLQIGKPSSNRIQSDRDSCWTNLLKIFSCIFMFGFDYFGHCEVVIFQPLHTLSYYRIYIGSDISI